MDSMVTHCPALVGMLCVCVFVTLCQEDLDRPDRLLKWADITLIATLGTGGQV